MPEITKKYQFKEIVLDNLYSESLDILKEIGAEKINEESASGATSKGIKAVIPSIWGWGGMSLKLSFYQEGAQAVLELTGYIAQLATGPLTKKIDEFLKKLSSRLSSKYGYAFVPEKLTTLVPKFKLKINKKDKHAFLIIAIGVLLIIIAGQFLGRVTELFLSSLAVGLAYYFGKKYLYKSKE